jgi:hypothetical protein
MPCKVEIEKHLRSDIEARTNEVLGKSLADANSKAREINAEYKAPVVKFIMDGDFMDRFIEIPDSLIDVYYEKELILEGIEEAKNIEEARKIQREDAARVQKDYDDSYLFQKDIKVKEQEFIDYVMQRNEEILAPFESDIQALVDYVKVEKKIDLEKDFDTAYQAKRERALEELNKKIDTLRRSISIPVEIDYNFEHRGGVVVKDGKRHIVINPDKMTTDTIFHEFGHIYIDLLGGLSNKFIQRGVEQLKGTALWNEVAKNYPELTEEQLSIEVLAEAIGREGAGIFDMAKDKSIFLRWLDILFNKLKSLVGIETNVAKALATDLIKNKLRAKVPSYNAELQEYFQKYVTETADGSKLAESQYDSVTHAYNKILHKASIFKSKQGKRAEDTAARLETLRADMQKFIEANQDHVAILSFFKNALAESSRISAALQASLNKATEEGSRLEASILTGSYEYVQAYKNIGEILYLVQTNPELLELSFDFISNLKDKNLAEEIRKEFNFEKLSKEHENQEDLKAALLKEFERITARVERNVNKVQQLYEVNAFVETSKTLAPFNEKVEKDAANRYEKEFIESKKGAKYSDSEKSAYINQKMEENREKIEAEKLKGVEENLRFILKDIDGMTRELVNMKDISDKGDPIIALTARMINYYDDVHVKNPYIEFEKELISIYEGLKEYKGKSFNPETLFEDLLERDRSGNLTGYIVDKYYMKEYLQARTQVFEEAKDLKGRAKFNKIEEGLKKIQSSVVDPAYKKARQDYIDEYGDKDIKNWEKENRNWQYLPADKFKNSNFDKLNPESSSYLGDDNAVVKAFKFYTEKMEQFDSYAPRAKLGRRLPGVLKSTKERALAGQYSLKEIQKRAKEAFTETPDDTGRQSKLEIEGMEGQYILDTESGKIKKFVPLYYRKKVDIKDISLDLFSSLSLVAYNTMKYRAMSEIEPTLELIKQAVADRKVGKTTSKGKIAISAVTKEVSTDSGRLSNAYQMLESFLDDRVYQESLTSDRVRLPGDWGIDRKVIDKLMGYTSSTMLAFNIPVGIANVSLGESLTIAESIGGLHYGKKNLAKAHKEYLAEFMNGSIVSDLGRMRLQSKTNLLLERYDGMNSFRGLEKKFTEDSMLQQIFKTKNTQGLNAMGEHFQYSLSMGAVLDNTKVQNIRGEFLNTEGKVVQTKEEAASLLDLYKVNDNGRIVLPSWATHVNFNGRTMVYNADTRYKITTKIQRINQMLHGAYSDKNKMNLQRHTLWRLTAMYRKWIVPGLQRRWSGDIRGAIKGEASFKYDYSLGEYFEGNYITGIRFLSNVIRNLKEQKLKVLSSQWSALTPLEKSNMRKNIYEAGLITSLLFLGGVLKNLADDADEEDKQKYYLLAYSVTRLRTELTFFSDPTLGSFWAIVKSPTAAVSMIERIINLASQALSDLVNWEFEEYKTGTRKGDTKLYHRVMKVTPVWNSIERLGRMDESYNFLTKSMFSRTE